jgi:hypothetical protein
MSTQIQISSGGGNVDYSNVAWVDAINGSDLTGAIGDFTKPFATAAQAVNTANSFGFTANNRGLVYVRRGQYSDQIGLLPNIDFYCEPGTVWIAGGFVDTVTTGSVGIYGSAKFVTDARALLASYSSTIYMEFDEINQNTNLSIGAVEIMPTSAYTSNVIISCKKIYSNCKNAYGITIRGNSFVSITAEEIKGPYQVVYLRYSADSTDFNGTLTINCPRIVCEDGGWGGNVAAYKNCYNQLRLASTAVVTINGNLINNTANIGNICPGVVSTQGNNESFTLNGNITGTYGTGYNITGTGSKFTHKGDIVTGFYCAITNGTISLKIVDSNLRRIATGASYAAVVVVQGTGKIYIINSTLVNLDTQAGLISNPSSAFYLYNVQYYTTNPTGVFCSGGNLGAINVISNCALSVVSVPVNAFTTLGLTVDTLFTLPTF